MRFFMILIRSILSARSFCCFSVSEALSGLLLFGLGAEFVFLFLRAFGVAGGVSAVSSLKSLSLASSRLSTLGVVTESSSPF